VSFDSLHSALQYHIVNSIGWPGLREVQEACIAPVLAGQNIIVQAQTAGGKTEAAFFPLISRMLTERWEPLSILYISPLRALINNQESRLKGYFQLVGHEAAPWHGDVPDGDKKRLRAHPPSCLLTTPESLEAMLIGVSTDKVRMFANLQAVVVDEVHAFAGDDRGWHLMSVLSRLSVLAGRPIQRIGLSATVGNPQDLAEWLNAGVDSPHSVIRPASAQPVVPEVQLDYVGSAANAAKIISLMHRGEKRLVFTDSRARAEEIGGLLRGLEVRAFVTHSSLSKDVRGQTERAFAEEKDCVIVATSALELGIDIGDLDRVIQIDAPTRVASFLQRMGRTGRRGGTVPNCLFLATDDAGLERAAGLIQLWESGYVEPVVPPPRPYHLLAQQVMALALQTGGLHREDWKRWLADVPGMLALPTEDVDSILQHLIESKIFRDDHGLLWFDETGEKTFGRRHFMELVSVFTSQPVLEVLHGRNSIATLDQLSFAVDNGAAIERGRPTILTLAGRHWVVTEVDWKRRQVFVVPAKDDGKSRWAGGSQDISRPFAEAERAVLTGEAVSPRWSKRAVDKLTSLRETYSWIEGEGITGEIRTNQVEIWTFAGTRMNRLLAAQMDPTAEQSSFTHRSVLLKGSYTATEVVDLWSHACDAVESDARIVATEQQADAIKFSDAVPVALRRKTIEHRLDPQPKVIGRNLKLVSSSSAA
jgi:ATP-dependent helicase Lhr and Lhr-like helicase